MFDAGWASPTLCAFALSSIVRQQVYQTATVPPQHPLPGDSNPSAEPPPTSSAMPIDVRSTSLALLAFIALVVFLRWAQDIFIPITFAVLLSYALTPIVDWLKRNAKLHKAIGAALTLALILGALGLGLSSLRPEALNILDIVPRAIQKFSTAMRGNSRIPTG